MAEKLKCDASGMCNTLLARLSHTTGKGFHAVNTINFDTGVETFQGVSYKMDSKDRGLMLNVCPFCSGEPGAFERLRQSSNTAAGTEDWLEIPNAREVARQA